MANAKPKATSACVKWSTLIGGLFLSAPNGIMWYWGNMSVYVMSYLRMTGITRAPVEVPWLLSAYLMCWCLVLLVAASVIQRLGHRMTIVLGILLIDGGLWASHWAVQHSLDLLNVTHGVLGGLGHGLIYSIVLLLVIDSTDRYVGLTIATMSTSVNVGGAAMNELLSHYVNPDNKTPDLYLGPKTYFTQTDVIDRVPTSYFWLAGLSTSCHVTGLLLVPWFNKVKSKADDEPQPEDALTEAKKPELKNGDTRLNQATQLRGNEKVADYRPAEVLRSRAFYVLWIVLIIFDMGYLAVNNYYKSFGEEFIHSDHSLADLGSAIPIVVSVSRILSGLLIDNVRYVKDIMLFFASGLSVGFAFLFVTPILSAWLYYACSVALSALDSGVFSLFAIITLRLFGPAHFTTNYGLVMSSSIVLNAVIPSAFRLVLQRSGWLALFWSIGLCNGLAVVLVALVLPLV